MFRFVTRTTCFPAPQHVNPAAPSDAYTHKRLFHAFMYTTGRIGLRRGLSAGLTTAVFRDNRGRDAARSVAGFMSLMHQ